MSEMRTVEVEFKDIDCVEEALKEMGYQVQTDINGDLDMHTYNRGVQKAHVVVKKGSNGLRWSDLGFSKNSDGSFSMHYDDMDKINLNKLKQGYSESKIKKTVKHSSKFSMSSRTIDKEGKIKLRIRRNF